MARTTLDLDSELVAETVKQSGAPSKRAAIEEAMREYLNAKRRQDLIAMLGNTEIDLTPDELEEMRRPRHFDEAD